MAGILVDQNISQRMLLVLKFVMYLNPALFAGLVAYLLLSPSIKSQIISATFAFLSITVAVSTIISGWAFRRSLSKYFQGVFIARVVSSSDKVDTNVKVICVCYTVRFLFDFSRFAIPHLFLNFRKSSLENHKNISFAVFLFLIIIFVDFLPILMFISNLKYVLNSQTPLTPKLREVESPEFDLGYVQCNTAKKETLPQDRRPDTQEGSPRSRSWNTTKANKHYKVMQDYPGPQHRVWSSQTNKVTLTHDTYTKPLHIERNHDVKYTIFTFKSTISTNGVWGLGFGVWGLGFGVWGL